MDRTHPPLHFPIYALGAPPAGPRWLASVDGPLGHPVEGVWIGLGADRRDPDGPWAHVGTHRRDAGPGQSTDRDGRPAHRAVLLAVDSTMAEPLVVPADRRLDLLASAERRAAGGGWQRCTWDLAGSRVEARVLPWAGAWAGYTTAHPDVDVVVVAHDVEPDGLVLREVTAGHDIHTDLDAPVVFPDTVDASRAAAGMGSEEERPWWPAHPDHSLD